MNAEVTWRVWVTEADIQAARAAWVRARDGGAPPDRVLDLLQELDRLTRTAAFQAVGDPWSTGREPGAGTVVPSFTARRFLRPAARLSAVG